MIIRLKKTGKSVIVILTHGAPVPSPAYDEVDAVISAGYTGQGVYMHDEVCNYEQFICFCSGLQKLAMQC